MSANEKYELKARMFQIMTGLLAPGKDAPTHSSESMDTRQIVWNIWADYHGPTIRAAIQAIEEQSIQ